MTSAVARLYALVLADHSVLRRLGDGRRPSVGGDDGRSSARGARRAAGAGTGRVDPGQEDRRRPLGSVSPGSGRPEHGDSLATGQHGDRRTLGPRRHASAARRDEDLMIAHASFRAMGTEIELVLDADSLRSRSTGRGGVRAARAGDVAFQARLGALAAERRRRARRVRRPGPRRLTRARRPRGNRREIRPDGARRGRRSRVRPDFDEVAPTDGPRCGRRVRRRCDRRGAPDRGRARVPARPRRDRKGICCRACRGASRLSGPCLVSAGGDVAVRGVPAEGSGRWPSTTR